MAAAGPLLTTGSTLPVKLLSMEARVLASSGWCHGITVSQRAPREPVSDKEALVFQLVPQRIVSPMSPAHLQLNNFIPKLLPEYRI